VLLMGMGAWVKANGAGLSCPDWPACYGEWLPPFPSAETEGSTPGIQGPNVDHAEAYTHAQVLYEWGHRFVASIVGAVVLAFAIVAVRGQELAHPTRQLPAMAFCLVIFQAVLGGITVRTGNPPWATTAHMVTAVAFLLALPCFVLAVQAKALWLAFILFLIPTGLNLVWLGPVITAVQHLVAPAQRSTASACFLFVNNLIGLGLGTWYFGAVSDALAPRFGAESLRYAIYSGLTFYVVSATLFVFAARGLKRDWVE